MRVYLGVSQTATQYNVQFSDLNLSLEQWHSLTDEQKKEQVQEYIDGMSEQPYWIVENIVE